MSGVSFLKDVLANYIVCCFCSRAGSRCINVYDSKDISCLMANVELDPSPATLMLFYDEDSSTIFATGKVTCPVLW